MKLTTEEVRKALSIRGNVAVFSETPDYLVLLKSAGIPSAPLKSGKRSALEAVSADFPEILSVKGKNAAEGGLLHRIDEETAGLLLVARTQDFYDQAQTAQKSGSFVKYYTAYCMTEAPRFIAANLPYTIESRFRPLGEKGAMVKPVFEGEATRADLKKAGSAVYRTTVLALEPIAHVIRARCSITAGFRHQVRSHLAATGYPVIGDALYGGQSGRDERVEESAEDERMLFFASGLELKEVGLSVKIAENVLDEIALRAIGL